MKGPQWLQVYQAANTAILPEVKIAEGTELHEVFHIVLQQAHAVGCCELTHLGLSGKIDEVKKLNTPIQFTNISIHGLLELLSRSFGFPMIYDDWGVLFYADTQKTTLLQITLKPGANVKLPRVKYISMYGPKQQMAAHGRHFDLLADETTASHVLKIWQESGLVKEFTRAEISWPIPSFEERPSSAISSAPDTDR